MKVKLIIGRLNQYEEEIQYFLDHNPNIEIMSTSSMIKSETYYLTIIYKDIK